MTQNITIKNNCRLFFCLILLLLVTSTSKAEDEKFKVGVILPLSGVLAEYGNAAKNGIELAQAENSELFTNIQFIYEDSQWDPKQAVSSFNKLRTVDRVNLIYNWGNPTSEAIAPIAEKNKFPLLAMSVDASIAVNRKYMLRSLNPAGDFSKILAENLLENNYQNIGVILADNTYVQGLYEGLEQAINKKANLHIVDTMTLSEQDFKTVISKIKKSKIDALGVFLISGQISNFYKQMQAQNFSLPTFGTDFFESGTEIELAQGGMNAAVYPHLGITPEFRNNYTKKYSNDYQIAYAGNSYDMAMMLAQQFNQAAPQSSEQILVKFQSIKNQPGVGGLFSYEHTPELGAYFKFPVELKKIENQSIKTIATSQN